MRNLVMYLFLILLAPLSVAQGQINVKDSAQIRQPVEVPQIVVKVPYGKLTSFGDIGIKIVKVIDSRCPTNVTCIWAGNVVLNYEVYKNGKFLETKKLILGGGKDVADDRLLFKTELNQLKAHSVVPYPKASFGKTPQEDYVINMIWKPNEM